VAFEKFRRPIVGPFFPQSTRKVITSAQYLALFTTPIAIVPAARAGWANVLVGAVVHKPAGTAYAGANNLVIKYTDGAGLEVSQLAVAGFHDSTAVQTRWMKPHTAASGANTTAIIAAAPLVAQILVANPTVGDSSIVFRTWYIIVPMVP
jgi:hypothetical protein